MEPDRSTADVEELLPDYLDRDLQDRICAEVRAHLEECEDCRVYVESIETTIVLYKQCPGADVPDEVRIDLRKHIRAHLEKKRGGGE